MDGFRAVYHQAPGDVHAPDSVNAVAELLAEQGRALHDAKSLKAAVGQYEFLRTQYPGSSLRVGALLAEAQIYENDLHDAAAARERYALLVKQYPRSEQAEEAKAGIASLVEGKTNRRAVAAAQAPEDARRRETGQSGDAAGGGRALVAAGGAGGGGSSFAPMPTTAAEAARGAKSGAREEAGGDRASDERHGTSNPVDAELNGLTASEQSPSQVHGRRARCMWKRRCRHSWRGTMAQVTGIRHWSTPTYTRVAIDLQGDDVTYEAARVPESPDRIYFDLHGTRLAQEAGGEKLRRDRRRIFEEDTGRRAVF